MFLITMVLGFLFFGGVVWGSHHVPKLTVTMGQLKEHVRKCKPMTYLNWNICMCATKVNVMQVETSNLN